MGLLKNILAALLAFVFLMAGGNKVTDKIHPGTHAELSSGFQKSFGPIWANIINNDLKVPADSAVYKMLIDDGSKTYEVMRTVIGATEVACAVMLFSPMRSLAAFVLFSIMLPAVYSHHLANDGGMAVPAVLASLLVLLLLPESAPAKPTKKKTK
eukprot:CAMPEP_0174926842 /NCGR_PEP_ID=MMETSP1355-20121228/15390_1 /TAXON_ID=464990 /ORGANISM="Hemiselmis tepida, Strain CCMP443" /LENGTH=154 /DNA_ID=CAMNT_0016172909 /DNA_START=21 /DNA_END=485 /DNA_ORIENTATION=+